MEEQRSAGQNDDRRGIQSIEVGGALLQALVRAGAPMMLKDLAREAGMPPAKAHPYLVSFGKLGLVEQDSITGRYGLGPFSLHMGLTALHGLDPLRAAGPEVACLADEIDLNVAIAVWGNHGPTIVRIEECSKQIHVNMRPGTVMTPLLSTATGRVFAAFLPERIIRPLVDGELAHPQAVPRLSRRHADEVLDEVRQQGLARAAGMPIPGINAFSAPVFDSSGQLALAITAMGPAEACDVAWDGPIAQKVKACAERVSDRLGGAGARS